MEALMATAGSLINVLPAPLKALIAEVVSRIKLIRLREVAVWFTNLFVFQFSQIEPSPAAMGDLAPPLVRLAFHWVLAWKCSHPCILPFYFFHLLFRKKHVFMFGCHWCCNVCHFSGLVGWLCQLVFFVSRRSKHLEYP